MLNPDVSRRDLLKGGAAMTGLSVLQVAGPERAFGQAGGQVIPWLDQPAANPAPPEPRLNNLLPDLSGGLRH